MAGVPEDQHASRDRVFSKEPLTPDENERLRRMLEADDRARWFWSTIRTWVIWMGGVSLALVAMKDTIAGIIRSLGGK